MKNFLSVSFLFITAFATSQTINDIYGNWKFESVAEVQTDKKGAAEKITPYLEKLSYHFYPDGNYEAGIMDMSEAGKFTMEGNKITADNGTSKTEVILLAATPDRLTIKIEGLATNMARVPPDGDKLLIAKHWKLTGIRKAEEEARVIKDDSSLVFNGDTTYSINLGATKETGHWDYRDLNGKKHIVTAVNGKPAKYWPLVSVDQDQLVLVLSNNGQEFIFTVR